MKVLMTRFASIRTTASLLCGLLLPHDSLLYVVFRVQIPLAITLVDRRNLPFHLLISIDGICSARSSL
jgi:hypothetical protein